MGVTLICTIVWIDDIWLRAFALAFASYILCLFICSLVTISCIRCCKLPIALIVSSIIQISNIHRTHLNINPPKYRKYIRF